MQLLPLSPEQIRLVLSAMKAVALANGSFSDEERTLLEAVADALSSPSDLSAMEPASPRMIAAAFDGEEERQHVIQMLVFTAMVDGDANKAELGVIEAFAGELGIDAAFIHGARRLAANHLNELRLDMVRRLPPRGEDEPEATEDEGWRGLWRVFGAASRAGENIEIAWRHKALGLLREGTLGRAYWEHMTERKLLFPGERGAILPSSGQHDFLHVITGYDTTVLGETELTAFIAGLRKMEDPFALIFGTLCVAHLGERLAKGTTSSVPVQLDPERLGAAFRRGLFAAVDFNEGWDYLADVGCPIDELLRRYTITES